MAETAAWLVEHVIPKVPVRQWVLSFPIPLRSLFAVHPELLAPVPVLVVRSEEALLRVSRLPGTLARSGGAEASQGRPGPDDVRRVDAEDPMDRPAFRSP